MQRGTNGKSLSIERKGLELATYDAIILEPKMKAILTMINKFIYLLILAGFTAANIAAQPKAMTEVKSTGVPAFMQLKDVREGMKGKSLTVFRGSKPEEFDVEILGVLPGGVGPKQDLIIGKISGGPADRTAVFAGMSGSPVYIDGKLIGAISYSFAFSKEAICGITPIQQMIDIFEQRDVKAEMPAARSYSFSELASAQWQPEMPFGTGGQGGIVSGVSQNSAMMSVAGQTFKPIGVPLTFTGIRQETLDLFAPQLLRAGLVPVAAVGGSAEIGPMKKADETTLRGGDSVSMHLARGDYSLVSSGTVTMRDGEKIYAFGHPFLSLGTSELPMAESSVVTVIPNMSNSFKLAVPGQTVGTMTQDRATGVFGKLGQAPQMIPVKITSRSSRDSTETINVEVAKDEFLTPLLLNIAVVNTLLAQERSIGDTTVVMNGEIKLNGKPSIKLQRKFAGGSATMLAAGSVALPVNTLMKSRFEDLKISGIELDLRTTDGSETATLDRALIERKEVKAGDTINVELFARTTSGRTYRHIVPVKIPEDAAAGGLSIVIGDGNSIQKNDAIQHFVAKDLSELVQTINLAKTPDRLYVRLVRTSTGAIVGSSEMPNLPPSVLATLNNDRTTGGVKPYTQNVIGEYELPQAEFIITGEQKLEIRVVN